MEPLLKAREMEELEARAFASGLPEMIVMEHAALAVCRAIEQRFAGIVNRTRGLVLSGPGGNGADAIAAGRMLKFLGATVEIATLSGLSPLGEIHLRVARAWGAKCSDDWPALENFDWVIDGLFGIGLKKPLEGKARAWVERLNVLKPHPWVVSVDIPSGLEADTGEVRGVAVVADVTLTFGSLKRGLVTGVAANHVGELLLSTVQLPRPEKPSSANLLELSDVWLPRRPKASHKGQYGHVKIWCGPKSRQGAAVLAAHAALRTGVGLVSLIGRESDLDSVTPRLAPEVMVEIWEGKANATAIAAGPGMGTGEVDTVRELCMQSAPLVLDADAITVLGHHLDELRPIIAQRRSPTVLTPHPKEALRVLKDAPNDRYQRASQLVDLTGCSVVLKGHGTIVAVPGEPLLVIREGNAALSRGGAGDMLSGIIAGFLAQSLSVKHALAFGVFFEGRAAERLSEERGGQASVTISEITAMVGKVIDECPTR